MNRFSISVVGFLAFANLLLAYPEAVETAKNELVASMKAEDEAKVNAGASSRGDSRLNYNLRSLETAMQKESMSYVDSALQNLSDTYRSEGVRVSLAKFRDVLNGEYQRKQGEEVAACEALLKDTREKMLAATKPQDLDPLLMKIETTCKDSSSDRQPKLQEAYQSLRAAKQIVSNWQDYLQAVVNGNSPAAVQFLRNITSNSTSSFVPRSVILAKIQEQEGGGSGIAEILAKIKQLDDIAPAIADLRRLRTIRSGYSSSNELDAASRILSSLEKSYRNSQNGLPVELELTSSYNDYGSLVSESVIASLRADLLLRLLPRYIGAPEKSAARTGEGVLPFLDRLAAEARDRGDAATALRAVETANSLKHSGSSSTADSAGLKDYLAGENQETAGQVSLAVSSYQRALKSGSTLVPAKLIGARLGALKQSHAAEYEEGMKSFLDTPPSGQLDGMDPYLRGRFPYPSRESSMPGRPTLLIPPPEVPKTADPAPSPQMEKPADRPITGTKKPEPSKEESGQ